MRVFIAGASGVIGVRLIPLLAADGHVVAGMTRSAAKADLLRELGALPALQAPPGLTIVADDRAARHHSPE